MNQTSADRSSTAQGARDAAPPGSPRTGLRGFAGGSKKPRNPWLLALKIGASAGLIAYILSRADLAAVGDALRGVRPGWFVLGIGLQFIGAGLIALRWQGLLAVHDVRPGFGYLYRSTLVSTFFRQFLPSIIGGDVVRGHDAWRAGASPGLAVMSLVVDRLMGLLALGLLALTALLFVDSLSERLPSLRLWLLPVFAALVGVIGLLVLPLPKWIANPAPGNPSADNPVSQVTEKGGAGAGQGGGIANAIRGKLTKIGGAFQLYRNRPAVLARALGLSLVLQCNVVTFYWTLAMALGLPVSYASFYAIAPIAIFVMMIPISINAIGMREGIFIFLLGQWGVATADALALAWLEYGLFLAFGLLGGVIYALRRT